MTNETQTKNKRLETISGIPRYLFHGTSSEFSSHIESVGLEANCEGYAFFDEDYKTAHSWGEEACKNLKSEYKHPGKVAVYYVDTRELLEKGFEIQTPFDDSPIHRNTIYKVRPNIPSYHLRKVRKLQCLKLRFGGKI